jgi:hypothetical protein
MKSFCCRKLEIIISLRHSTLWNAAEMNGEANRGGICHGEGAFDFVAIPF